MGGCNSRPKTIDSVAKDMPESRDATSEHRKHETLPNSVNDAPPNLPGFMQLSVQDRESLVNSDVHAVIGVDLTEEQKLVVDNITRPIAKALYENSDQTQPSVFYWDQAQRSVFV
jgi:hypothetical protein